MGADDNVSMEMHCNFCKQKYFVDFSHKDCSTNVAQNDNSLRKNHDVRSDYYLINQNYRITCHSIGCHNATLIRHSNTSFDIWELKLKQFCLDHPSDEIKNENFDY